MQSAREQYRGAKQHLEAELAQQAPGRSALQEARAEFVRGQTAQTRALTAEFEQATAQHQAEVADIRRHHHESLRQALETQYQDTIRNQHGIETDMVEAAERQDRRLQICQNDLAEVQEEAFRLEERTKAQGHEIPRLREEERESRRREDALREELRLKSLEFNSLENLTK